MNHSCDPNVQVTYNHRNDETLVVTALRDLEPGEELFISYIDESMEVDKRMQQLDEHYKFQCACTKCTAELSEQKAEESPP
eukprot:NODE_4356_length_350_cov_350.033223_g3755_i0.p1 GENE.NODE_4356_length_350_cov_350.033223_g3755_i0~~NODE_4356_length_350_cov_350.033223_g3755_i0.p1  ORF type:complete len:81 (+),score=8.23 NODE_4356_length_350_cov_350.033223_g3755_i0:75-317(+)